MKLLDMTQSANNTTQPVKMHMQVCIPKRIMVWAHKRVRNDEHYIVLGDADTNEVIGIHN